MTPDKSIIIIGGGIAGLAAGCYGQMNGYQTEIFELHDLPGGLCTAWERDGYLIDGCIHYLFGTAPGKPFHQVWQELGPLKDRPIIHHDELMRVVGPDGRTFIAYADPDRLEAHLKGLSPADADEIESLAEGIRQLTRFDMSVLNAKPRTLMSPNDLAEFGRQVMPFALAMTKWGRLTAEKYARRFHDPLFRRAIPLIFGWGQIPMMAGMAILAYMAIENAGFPAGGSLDFARAVERRYLDLGGVIHYKAQVEKILVENDRAVGVRLYDDQEHRAEYIISAADAHGTIYHLLDGQYTDGQIDRLYDGRLLIHSQVQVSLGVDRDFSAEPHWLTYLLDEPLLIAGEERSAIGVKHYCFDPGLAPEGKSVIEVMIESKYAYWQKIYGRRLYDTEQLQVADIIVDFLEQRYPGIGAAIEVKDVATPLSYERYTGNWQGSTCGWLLTDKTMMMMVKGMGKTLPGLDNLILAGHWVEPGGSVPLAAMSGRNAIQLICAQDNRPFVTTTA